MSIDIRRRLQGILEYICQVEKLKRKPTFIVPENVFCAYQSNLKGLPGIEFNLHREGDDVWCLSRVSRKIHALSLMKSSWAYRGLDRMDYFASIRYAYRVASFSEENNKNLPSPFFKKQHYER